MKIKKYAIIVLFCFLYLFFPVLKVSASPISLRINGSDRYDTAIKLSQNSFNNADNVILVQGDNFADALSASPLGQKYKGPILFVKPSGLDDGVLKEISRLKAKNVLIVGGEGVIPSSAEKQIKSLNNSITIRRFSGIDRYDTSAKVAKDIGTSNGVAIVSGQDFPDGVSIASIAAQKQMPILLMASCYIPDSIQNFIDNNKINNFYVIGGKGVIYDSTISKLQNVKRICGANRYQTNLAVLNEFKDSIKLNSVYVASGEQYPDALSGSVVAALTSSPLMLTDSYDRGILEYVNDNIASISNIVILGGTQAVSASMEYKLTNPSLYIRKVLGYATYYHYNAKESYNTLVNNYQSIDEIATDTFSSDGQGNLIAEKGYNSSGSAVDLIPYEQISFANSKNISSYVMVTCGSADTARTLLTNASNRQNFINNIVSAMKTYNYKGINVDIEGIYSSDRDYFTQFMKELYNTLKPNGYSVTIAVPAKTKDDPSSSWSGGYNYSEISKYADEVIIMAYDEHWSGGTAGSIASINWVNNVINYAISTIPKEKILLGLASYGYDWASSGEKAKAYNIDQAYNVAQSYGASVLFDNDSKCPHFSYTQNGIQHSVWFENGQSIGYKIDLVNKYDIGGIAIWNLGQTNQDYWQTIKSKLNK